MLIVSIILFIISALLIYASNSIQLTQKISDTICPTLSKEICQLLWLTEESNGWMLCWTPSPDQYDRQTIEAAKRDWANFHNNIDKYKPQINN